MIKIKHGTKEDAANVSGLLLNVLKLSTTVNGNFLEIHCVFLFLRVPTRSHNYWMSAEQPHLIQEIQKHFNQ